MADIQKAKEQVSKVRQQISTQREQAKKQKQILKTAREKLPSIKSARALRTGAMAGLNGRTKRQQIKKIGEGIEKQEAGIRQYEQELSKFETERIKPIESQIKQAEIQERAYSQAESLIEKGKAAEYLAFVKTGDYEGEQREEVKQTRAILENYMTQKRLAKKSEQIYESISSKIGEVGVEGLTELEKKRLDKGLKTGALSFDGKINGSLNEVKSLKDYQKFIKESKPEEVKIEKLESSSLSIPSQNVLTSGIIEERKTPTKFLDKVSFAFQESISKIETEKARTSRDDPKKFILGFGSTALGAGKNIPDALIFGRELLTNPKATAVNVGTGILGVGKKVVSGQGLPEVGQSLRERPSVVIGSFAGDVFTGFLGGKILSDALKLSKAGIARLSPKFRALESGVIKNIPLEKSTFDLRTAGAIKTIEEPLKKQVKLAGKEVNAVSAQRGLFDLFRRKIEVDKPLPSPDAPKIEKSFFADPRGRLRVSRLGIDDSQTAGIIDYLSGDVSLKRRPKPQALIFEKAKIEKFPEYLKDLELKLKKGEQLSPQESERLLQWQLNPSGEFKPIGFLSKEPEITLAPGEIIFKKKNPAKTIINNRVVNIIETGIKEASTKTKELLEKLRNNKITKVELEDLNKRLKKETGIDYSQTIEKKYISPQFVSSILSPALSTTSTLSKSSSPAINLIRSSIYPASTSKKVSSSGIIKILGSKISPPASTSKKVSSSGIIKIDSRRPLIEKRTKKPTPAINFINDLSSKKSQKPSENKINKMIKTEEEGFDILVKKKGEWVDVGDAKTPGKAFTQGKKELLKDLAASLKVLDKKTGLPVSNKAFVSKLFRQSKNKKIKDTVLVQRKSAGSGRLTTKGERMAIKRTQSKSFKSNFLSQNKKSGGFKWI